MSPRPIAKYRRLFFIVPPYCPLGGFDGLKESPAIYAVMRPAAVMTSVSEIPLNQFIPQAVMITEKKPISITFSLVLSLIVVSSLQEHFDRLRHPLCDSALRLDIGGVFLGV